MRLPRDLSGQDLVRLLVKQYGYRQVHQEGSHIVLQSESPPHRIAIPNHDPLRLGTLNSILRAVARAQGIDKQIFCSHHELAVT